MDEDLKNASALKQYMDSGNLPKVKYFYSKLVNKQRFINISARTPLQYAVEEENLHMVELLVDLGADIFENCPACIELPIKIAHRSMILHNSSVVSSLSSTKLGMPGSIVRATGFRSPLTALYDVSEERKPAQNLSKHRIHFRIKKGPYNFAPSVKILPTAILSIPTAFTELNQNQQMVSDNKFVEIYDFLELKTRESMNILNNEGNSPLTLAVMRQCVPAIELLLEKGADITLRGPNGVTPLFAAVESANPDIVALLAKHVPKSEITNDLHFAIEKQTGWEIVKQFLELGADLASTNATTQTALHLAAKIYKSNLINYIKENSNTLNETLAFAMARDDLDTVRCFIEYQPNMLNSDNVLSEYFFKAMTIRNMPVDLFNLTSLNNLDLLRRYFDDRNFKALNLKCLNEHNNDGDTLLILAIREKNFELVKFLIELGANVCKSNKNGIVPLDQAVSSGHYDICSYLLQNGAEFTVKTALNRAIRGKLPQFVKLFVAQGVNLNTTSRFENLPLVESLLTKDIEIVKILIENGANVDTTNYDGKIPLDLAIELGFTDAVKLFIENGISPNRMAKSTGETLLHKYLDDLDFEMVFFLINHNVDVNKVDQNNECALVKVARMKNAQLLNSLLKNGADPFCEHFKDDPLLSIAATEEYFPVVVFLIEKGANIRGSKQQLQNFATNNVNFAMYLEEIGIDLAAAVVEETIGNKAAEPSNSYMMC